MNVCNGRGVSPGDMNIEMNNNNKYVNTIHLHMNTIYRDNLDDNPENSSFTFTQSYNNIVGMKLLNIEIANSWYMIYKNNDSFKLCILLESNIEDIKIIQITHGNYSIDTFLFELNSKIREVIEEEYNEDITIHVDTNEKTLQINFKVVYTSTRIKSVNVIFSDITKTRSELVNSLGWIMGFRVMSLTFLSKYYDKNENINNDIILKNDENTIVITSKALFNGSRDRYIYFVIDDYESEQSLNDIILNNEMLNKNILGKIFLCEGGFGLNVKEYTDNNTVLMKRFKQERNIRKICIKILDQHGELLDLNQMDFSFSLEFIQIFNYLKY